MTLEQQERLFSLICESNVYNVYAPMFTVLLETGLRCGVFFFHSEFRQISGIDCLTSAASDIGIAIHVDTIITL